MPSPSDQRRTLRRMSGLKKMPELVGEGEPCLMCTYMASAVLGKHAENFADARGRQIGLVIQQAGKFMSFMRSDPPESPQLCAGCTKHFFDWLTLCDQMHHAKHGRSRIVVPGPAEVRQALTGQMSPPAGKQGGWKVQP